MTASGTASGSSISVSRLRRRHQQVLVTGEAGEDRIVRRGAHHGRREQRLVVDESGVLRGLGREPQMRPLERSGLDRLQRFEGLVEHLQVLIALRDRLVEMDDLFDVVDQDSLFHLVAVHVVVGEVDRLVVLGGEITQTERFVVLGGGGARGRARDAEQYKSLLEQRRRLEGFDQVFLGPRLELLVLLERVRRGVRAGEDDGNRLELVVLLQPRAQHVAVGRLRLDANDDQIRRLLLGERHALIAVRRGERRVAALRDRAGEDVREVFVRIDD
jgi:hypothetical protein